MCFGNHPIVPSDAAGAGGQLVGPDKGVRQPRHPHPHSAPTHQADPGGPGLPAQVGINLIIVKNYH